MMEATAVTDEEGATLKSADAATGGLLSLLQIRLKISAKEVSCGEDATSLVALLFSLNCNLHPLTLYCYYVDSFARRPPGGEG